MTNWHPEMKKRFRGEVLRMLAVRHGQQMSRTDDVALCHALRSLAWDVDINDVVTILQEMQGRNWVRFRQIKSIYNMRIPHSNLHRWYDLRVRQVQKEVLVRSEQARTVAESFAKSNLVNGDEAVINAARDTLMGVLAEDGSEAGRLNATKGLIKLGELMQKARTNEIRERKVSVDD